MAVQRGTSTELLTRFAVARCQTMNSPSRMTLAALPIEQFVEREYRNKTTIGSPGSVSVLKTDCRKLDRYFQQWCLDLGERPRPLTLADLSLSLIRAAMRHDLDVKKRSPATANRLRRNILAVWRYAARLNREERRHNPAAALIASPDDVIEAFSEHRLEPRCWSMDELAAILDAAAAMKGRVGDIPAGTWHLAHLWFVYNTGARISAVMGTPIKNLNLDRGEVQLPAWCQKQKAEQTFDLKPQTIDALHRLRLERLSPDATIFADWPYDRSVTNWPCLTKRYKQILAAAGLSCGRKDLFHKLRRTFATFLARDQGIIAAQQWLGHSHVSVTERYIDMRYFKGAKLNGSLPDPKPPAATVQLRIWQDDAV